LGNQRKNGRVSLAEKLDYNPGQRCECENLFAALWKTNLKIKGADGAAELLGVKLATLLTRMKKTGLKRPA
jgi:transcriptional regulator with GAF, ATPase, and Fis domain